MNMIKVKENRDKARATFWKPLLEGTGSARAGEKRFLLPLRPPPTSQLPSPLFHLSRHDSCHPSPLVSSFLIALFIAFHFISFIYIYIFLFVDIKPRATNPMLMILPKLFSILLLLISFNLLPLFSLFFLIPPPLCFSFLLVLPLSSTSPLLPLRKYSHLLCLFLSYSLPQFSPFIFLSSPFLFFLFASPLPPSLYLVPLLLPSSSLSLFLLIFASGLPSFSLSPSFYLYSPLFFPSSPSHPFSSSSPLFSPPPL